MLQPHHTSSMVSGQFERVGWWLGIIGPILILAGRTWVMSVGRMGL